MRVRVNYTTIWNSDHKEEMYNISSKMMEEEVEEVKQGLEDDPSSKKLFPTGITRRSPGVPSDSSSHRMEEEVEESMQWQEEEPISKMLFLSERMRRRPGDPSISSSQMMEEESDENMMPQFEVERSPPI